MLVPAECVVLRTIKYNDTRAIVHLLSRDNGRVAAMVNDGNTVAARRRRALMLPGSSFSCLLDIRENRSLQSLRDVMPRRVVVSGDPVASTVILFICDFLTNILRDNQPDANLFDFVDSAINAIVAPQHSIANAPIAFLFALQQLMGIAPDTGSYREGYCFDFADGTFRPTPPLQSKWLDAEQAKALMSLCRINMHNMHHFKLTRSQRQTVLDLLLQYYSTHFGSLRSMQSLSVVRSLFD